MKSDHFQTSRLYIRRAILRLTVFTLLTAFPVLSTFFCAEAAEQEYPSRSVEISIAFPPGGALDAAVRALIHDAEQRLGQPVTALNTPGSGGVPAVTKLAKAKPDGYSLAACVSNALIFIPHRNAVPYRPLRDVTPILSFGQAAPLLVTSPDAPWQTLEDFFAATHEKPGELKIAVPGLGTPSHIALAMMSEQDPSLKWRFIPFAGPGEAEAALLGGHVDAAASGALARVRQVRCADFLPFPANVCPPCRIFPPLRKKALTTPAEEIPHFCCLRRQARRIPY